MIANAVYQIPTRFNAHIMITSYNLKNIGKNVTID